MDKATVMLLNDIKLNIWNVNVAGNQEVAFETSFNQLLISICSEFGFNSNEITAFDFYNALLLFEKRNEK